MTGNNLTGSCAVFAVESVRNVSLKDDNNDDDDGGDVDASSSCFMVVDYTTHICL
jgi:hypothetical protein